MFAGQPPSIPADSARVESRIASRDERFERNYVKPSPSSITRRALCVLEPGVLWSLLLIESKRSFPKLVTLPTRELQERLDAMIIQLLGYPDELDHEHPSSSDTSLGHDLANLIDTVSNALHYSQPLKPFTDAD
jgi:hypothetical protein